MIKECKDKFQPLRWIPPKEFCVKKHKEEEKYYKDILSSKDWKYWYPDLTGKEFLIKEKQYNQKRMKVLKYNWEETVSRNESKYFWFVYETQITKIRIEVINKLLKEWVK